MEDILVYLSIVNNGDWNSIYHHIVEKKPINKEDVKKEVEKLNVKYITLLSPSYPTFLKSTFKPPFVILYRHLVLYMIYYQSFHLLLLLL